MSLTVAIRHRFADFTLDAAFEAPAGVTALFGHSGSGKTTLVNAVAGLFRPDAATIRLDGETLTDTAGRMVLPPHRRRIGYVFQEPRLFPHLSVRQNLRYGMRFARRRGDAGDFGRIVDLLGIGPLLARGPADLSGGEKQRVAIGRALLSAPRLLAMDEPLAALDDARKAEILPYLDRLNGETGVPILYVSHSVAEVARLATTVIALQDGRVLRAGPAADVLSDPQIVPFLGVREAGSILTGTVMRHHADGLTELSVSGRTLLLPLVDAVPGAKLRVRVLAQDVMLALGRPEGISALNILDCTVSALNPGKGPGLIVRLDCGGQPILARVTKRSAAALELRPGQRCHAVIKSVAIAPADLRRTAQL